MRLVFTFPGDITLSIPKTDWLVSTATGYVDYPWTNNWQIRVVLGFEPNLRKIERLYIYGSGTQTSGAVTAWQEAGLDWRYTTAKRDSGNYRLNGGSYTFNNELDEILWEQEALGTAEIRQLLFRKMGKLHLYI